MSKIPAPEFWFPSDISSICKAFGTDKANVERRMTNRALAIRSIAQTTNHLLGHQGPAVFAQVQSDVSASGDGADPLYQHRLLDGFDNGRRRTYRALILQPTTGSGDVYIQREDGAGSVDAKTISGKGLQALTAVFPQDLIEVSMTYDRGASAGEDPEGISSFPVGTTGPKIYDIVAYAEPQSMMDMASPRRYVALDSGVADGRPILADIVEDIRDDLYHLRTENLPTLFSWHAARGNGGWATPAAPGNGNGIAVTSTTLVNVIDQSVTTRTASSPGFTAHVQFAGIGDEKTAGGRKVKAECRVFAHASGGDAEIVFIGPDGIASNSVTIGASSAGAPAWHGTGGAAVFFDSSVADTETGTGRNKVDVHAKITAGTLYIYAIEGMWDV